MQLLKEEDIVEGASGNARTRRCGEPRSTEKEREAYMRRERGALKNTFTTLKPFGQRFWPTATMSFRNEVCTRTNVHVCLSDVYNKILSRKI